MGCHSQWEAQVLQKMCLCASPACHSRTLILLYLDSSEREGGKSEKAHEVHAEWNLNNPSQLHDLYYCVHEDIHNDCTALTC